MEELAEIFGDSVDFSKIVKKHVGDLIIFFLKDWS